MASFSRSRARDLSFHTSGTATYRKQRYLNGNPFGGPQTIIVNGSNVQRRTGHESCSDFVSDSTPYPDHLLDLWKKKTTKIGALNGTVIMSTPTPTGWSTDESMEYSGWSRNVWYHDTYAPNVTVGDWGYWKTAALAAITPYTPVVDVPLFLFELRELPRMIRQAGNILLQKGGPYPDAGTINLAHQLGWKPLVGDIVSLMNLVEPINNRLDYIRKVSESGRKHTRKVGNVSSQSTVGIASYDGVTYSIQEKSQLDVWAVYTLYAPSLSGKIPQLSRNRDIQRIVSGLHHYSHATLWNAIPWTWLIDYFVNVGDFLEAVNGAIRMQTSTMNLMQHKVVTSEGHEIYNANAPEVKWTPFKFTTEEKRRRVYLNPVPTIRMTPSLTWRQMGIIGSLVTAGPYRAYHRG